MLFSLSPVLLGLMPDVFVCLFVCFIVGVVVVVVLFIRSAFPIEAYTIPDTSIKLQLLLTGGTKIRKPIQDPGLIFAALLKSGFCQYLSLECLQVP